MLVRVFLSLSFLLHGRNLHSAKHNRMIPPKEHIKVRKKGEAESESEEKSSLQPTFHRVASTRWQNLARCVVPVGFKNSKSHQPASQPASKGHRQASPPHTTYTRTPSLPPIPIIGRCNYAERRVSGLILLPTHGYLRSATVARAVLPPPPGRMGFNGKAIYLCVHAPPG